MSKCWETAQFAALQSAAAEFKSVDGSDSGDRKDLHLRNLCAEPSRNAGLVASHAGGDGSHKMLLDYSRQQVTGETMELLFDLATADDVNIIGKMDEMRRGVVVNPTENRQVLHHALRLPKDYDFSYCAGGAQIHEDVHAVLRSIEAFVSKIRSGRAPGATGKPLRNVLAVGIGGSQLGPEFVAEALVADPNAHAAANGRTLKFLANVDPVDFFACVDGLDPEETMVVVVSKTFTTAETMLNARTAKNWLVKAMEGKASAQEVVQKHVCAVSTAIDKATDFGIDPNNIFGFWNWVGGRFSVCSAVGMVPLSLQYSFEVMQTFLAGAHDMDNHFFNTPLRNNIPVLLGLLGVWNSTFLGYETRAILPYAQALKRFPAHIQQVDMESNGKRVTLDGTVVPFATGEVNFGEPGTNGQHSFYQLMHQGRVVPADFIGFCESQQPVHLENEPVANHDELMSNFFAQPAALAEGKTLTELDQEGVPEALRAHKVFAGNRPSSSLLMSRLDAFAVGQLLATYEHRTAVQGFVWGINSFDQWGVELGKVLAKQVRTELASARGSGTYRLHGFDSNTTSLLEFYLGHAK